MQPPASKAEGGTLEADPTAPYPMWHEIVHKATGQPASYHRKAHYEFDKTLGAGAFGIVRRAHNKDDDRDVAIKIILKSKLQSEADQQALKNEFEILSEVGGHKNIVKFYEFFESKSRWYFVTELCTGGELFDRILDYGRFDERDASRIMREVAGALEFLHHKNIVHRDIKPENLLYKYASDDGSAPLMLCDFGVAKELMSDAEKIMTAAGSLGYAAPEIFTKAGHGKPVDVWSLGVVLYTLLSGVSPFQAETPREFIAEVQPGYKPYFYEEQFRNVSAEARDLVTKMLEYRPQDRLTIDEVLAHPWIRDSDNASTIDLLPVVAPQLKARKRWRAAYEKVLLDRMLKHLHMSDDSDDEDSGGATQGERFMQVVQAAKAQASLEKSS